MPVTFYLIVTGVIGGSQMYVEPRLMFTGNGPNNSTFTTVIHLYDRTFANSKAGYGSAVAVFLAVIVFINPVAFAAFNTQLVGISFIVEGVALFIASIRKE